MTWTRQQRHKIRYEKEHLKDVQEKLDLKAERDALAARVAQLEELVKLLRLPC